MRLPDCTSDKPFPLRTLYDKLNAHIRGIAPLGMDLKDYGGLLIPVVMSKCLIMFGCMLLVRTKVKFGRWISCWKCHHLSLCDRHIDDSTITADSSTTNSANRVKDKAILLQITNVMACDLEETHKAQLRILFDNGSQRNYISTASEIVCQQKRETALEYIPTIYTPLPPMISIHV